MSPGCRTTKVKIAKVYLGKPGAHWPTPKLDLNAERQRYEAAFQQMHREFADVEFTVDQLVTDKEGAARVRDQVADADGVLCVHLSMGVKEFLEIILAARKPTMMYAAPYSGHEWTQFGALRQQPVGERLECLLTSDLHDLAVAVRPFRAIHHLRETKIVNVTTRALDRDRAQALERFGVKVLPVDAPRVLEAYHAIDGRAVDAEARRWIRQATAVVEPPRDEIRDSCRLALAFERILAEERATVMTVDCYGTMYRKLPAFPCLGFVRLNDMGLAGICESDLTSAVTFTLLQGLSGRPGFISDPTMDESANAIILAHCLGTRKMDGPEGNAAPYKLRTIMERQEGVVPQVRMRVGEQVTQALLVGTEQVRYFTGRIIGTPDTERGCRTQITVQVDGDARKLWQNWAHGLHRVTVYGDLTPDLTRFCRFEGLKLVNEA